MSEEICFISKGSAMESTLISIFTTGTAYDVAEEYKEGY